MNIIYFIKKKTNEEEKNDQLKNLLNNILNNKIRIKNKKIKIDFYFKLHI